jgi:hypothetical protein
VAAAAIAMLGMAPVISLAVVLLLLLAAVLLLLLLCSSNVGSGDGGAEGGDGASQTCRDRRMPSNEKGFVTTPTVKQPAALAASATTGAAPEPVPPPLR